MFGIRFLRTTPTEYVLLYRKGKVVREGVGQSFFYYEPTSSLVIVPADTRDADFIYNETTADFQEIDIQGQITFRVPDPVKLASQLDFSVDAGGAYTGEGMEKLTVRMTNLVQIALREKLASLDLRAAIRAARELVEFARDQLKDAPAVAALGVEVIDLAILKISPTPEVARALEASAREMLLKEADEATYERRNFAVEQERRIQENELQTKIAVEEKNRQIQEEQMNAKLAVERKRGEIEELKLHSQIEREAKRRDLVDSRATNTVAEAKARAEAVRLELSALGELRPELLEVLATNQMDARRLVSRAFGDLARGAEKIGRLNISPDLLNSLLDDETES